MFAWFRRRYLDLLGSIYIYNEHRGYTSIDRVLEAVRSRSPDDKAFIAAIEKHRADERKHYVMFKPLVRAAGQDAAHGRPHLRPYRPLRRDHVRPPASTISTPSGDRRRSPVRAAVPGDLADRAARHKQVEILLNHPLVRDDKVLIKIFRIIEKDEPSHWAPYDGWLKAMAGASPNGGSARSTRFIHAELLFLKLPILFLNPWLKRRTEWADAHDPAEPLASPMSAAA